MFQRWNVYISLLIWERNRLSEGELRELEQLFDLCGQCDGMHSEASFVQGFRLGANMLIEVMSHEST